ncbi:MAG: DUF5698 domain-containing protein [Acidimicrobiia bacterium]|nr:DUF5698 domain-containing protein [Acidimicrobiia bacterium]
MIALTIPSTDLLATVGILALIIGLRIVDVSAGVLRVMFIMRGRRGIAAAVGFVESFTWLVAAAFVFASLDTPAKAIAYAGGFALGTWIGTWLEEKVAVGESVVRVFVPMDAPSPTAELRDAGFGVTEVPGEGLRGPVMVLFCVVTRRRAKDVMRIVAASYPEAFATVENIDTLDLSHRRYRPSRV